MVRHLQLPPRDTMTEDRYTNTPEDAAAFERSRAIDAGEDDRPTRAELAQEAAEIEWTCAHCGRELLPNEGWLCADCAEHDR